MRVSYFLAFMMFLVALTTVQADPGAGISDKVVLSSEQSKILFASMENVVEETVFNNFGLDSVCKVTPGTTCRAAKVWDRETKRAVYTDVLCRRDYAENALRDYAFCGGQTQWKAAPCVNGGLYCPEGNRSGPLACQLDDFHALICPPFSPPGGGPGFKFIVNPKLAKPN